MNVETCAKAMIALSAGLAEAIGDELSGRIVQYLVATADGPGCDPATTEMIWNLIEVMTPPTHTPRGLLAEIFTGAA
jgi:hypothetical protein